MDEAGPGDYELVEPRADALIESLRAFGYSPETAVADLIDNSLSAGATEVEVHFHWDGVDSWIAVSDDGRGMTESELREAMRPGTTNPLSNRRSDDLGRFGLGLKTASFSQCRHLVVASAAVPGEYATRTWDLDRIGVTGQWQLLTSADGVVAGIRDQLLPGGRGTVVLWRHLDRLVDRRNPAGELTERHFYRVADQVRNHLSVIFHRYLRGPGRVAIKVNGRPLKPWDPFLQDSSATQVLGDEHLEYREERIRVRSFVLPHVSRMAPDDHRSGGGARGWTSQQGYYVYRNRRLIVSGDWLGLGSRDEVTKLARIQLDLPNTMDQDWQIDVRKSVARPPASLLPQLKRIAEVARRGSIQVYRHRGKVLERSAGSDLVFAWEQVLRGGRVSYRINRAHPFVSHLARCGGDAASIEDLLRIVEETVPVPLILLDHAGGQSRQLDPFEECPEEKIRPVILGMVEALRREGLDERGIAVKLSNTEPFRNYPFLINEATRQEDS
jgi:hypothetical protein